MSDGLDLFTRGGRAARPELSTDRLYGAWPATVEYNADPEQRGRCKVRIYQLHGPPEEDEKKRIKSEHLPWAWPAFGNAGVQDSGSFFAPPVGSTVWVLQAGGQPNQFVYFGGYYATNKEPETYLKSMGLPKHEISMGEWQGEKGPEAPLDALEMLHGTPEVYVPAKSVKGATLLMDDKDERETTAIIDRMGQGVFLEAELTKDANKANAKRRRAKNLLRGKAAGTITTDTVATETRVFVLDAAGQSNQLLAHKGSERIKIISRPVEDDSANHAGHRDGMSVELDAGSRRIVIATSNAADHKARIVIDAAAEYVEIGGNVTVRIDARSLEVLGRTTIRGDLVVDGDQVVTGDQVVAGTTTGGETSR